MLPMSRWIERNACPICIYEEAAYEAKIVDDQLLGSFMVQVWRRQQTTRIANVGNKNG